jgi:hypothetical protein
MALIEAACTVADIGRGMPATPEPPGPEEGSARWALSLAVGCLLQAAERYSSLTEDFIARRDGAVWS